MKIGWQPTRHDALNLPAKSVFDSYFRRDPPFDKPGSKEFPDAFVVAALDSWCQKNHQKMYVITKDKAMLRAVEQTKTLLPLPTLEDYLALLVDDPKVVKEVERIFGSSAWDTVEESVREQLGHLGTVYTGDLHDGEVIDHEAGDGSVELPWNHAQEKSTSEGPASDISEDFSTAAPATLDFFLAPSPKG